ncbi:hypothetical protein BDV28DRAFT_134201 [Aspergillus coremiiformis]|uniref:Uncharacterized protein n=1 Tax=Aspergillus coremiiformis TaxID=138285 RepID=A0A5N6Z8B2_9EURO|nr:hypothetical protein BDV28DRAFT_134201 [Aspergillus coremiiformis]
MLVQSSDTVNAVVTTVVFFNGLEEEARRHFARLLDLEAIGCEVRMRPYQKTNTIDRSMSAEINAWVRSTQNMSNRELKHVDCEPCKFMFIFLSLPRRRNIDPEMSTDLLFISSLLLFQIMFSKPVA